MQNRIRELREQKRMTQIRLSIELGVTQETISAYEVGKHYPSVATLMQMRKIFCADIDYILGLSDIRFSANKDSLDERTMMLLSLYNRLSPVQKEKTMSYMQGMLE